MASAYRVAAPSIRIVPWAALASCWPLPQQLLPVSATGGGRRRCTLAIFSGRIIYNFAFVALCGALQTHFHGRGRGGKLHLQCRFLRKRGAAGNGLALSGANAPAPPKGEPLAKPVTLCGLPRAPPLGELANPQDLTERARTLAGKLPNEVRLKGFFLSLPTKNSPGGLPEEHSFFYSKHGCAALTWCAAGLTSGTLPQRGRRCRPECRTPEIRLRPARQPAAPRT